ncbi:MAG TPA: hypothetical protein VIK41_18725 [Gemmatimonadaceae bacterium]
MLRDSAAPGVGASAGHTRTRDSALGTSGLGREAIGAEETFASVEGSSPSP